MTKKPQPPRKRKGRSKRMKMPKITLSHGAPAAASPPSWSRTVWNSESGMWQEPAQRGPTAPPSPQMQQCKVPPFLAQMMGQAGSKPYRKPERPFADQQPRILSQMECEDWR